ncbi:MAG: glycosyltransferase family 2 protein [Thiotrichales bacterium]
MQRLLIVSVNYRTPELCLGCIASVAAERSRLPETRMVIVDNDSGDGSYERIRTAVDERGWSDWVSVVAADHNGGFAYGNNFAIRPALASDEPPDLIWLLNPDAEVLEGSGEALVRFLNDHPKAGMATSRWVPKDGQPATEAPTAFRRFSALGELLGTMQLHILERLFPKAVVGMWPRDEPFKADWLSGTTLMFKRAVVDDIGLMDEGYFLYFEESDYCLQAQRKGWELWWVPDSRFYHVIGASTGFTWNSVQQRRRPAYWFYSRRRYFVKNFGAAYAVAADSLHIVGYVGWRLRALVQRKPNLDPPHYLWDFLVNSVFAKGFKL